MRVFITLTIVFFCHLFLNVALASPHANTVKKTGVSTEGKQQKKALVVKNANKKKTVTAKKKITPPPKPAPRSQQKSHKRQTVAARGPNTTPALVVKGLKKTAKTYERKNASIRPGMIRADKEMTLSEAHKKRYHRAKTVAMNKLMDQLGKPYQWGGASPYTGFDCSGLVYYAYKDIVKIPIPRTANEMYHLRDAAPIKKNDLEAGDLVFFRINNRGAADHVGVYLGNGKFIQSPRTGSDIRISKLSEDYWQEHYVGARRVVTPQTIR